jgi:subtilase family protein
MTQNPIRYYVVVKANGEGVKPEEFNADSVEARRKAASHLYFLLFGTENNHPPFDVRAIPSNDVFSGSERPSLAKTLEIVVALDVLGDDKQRASDVVNEIIKAVGEKSKIFVGESPDLPFAAADHWCIGEASEPFFADRSAAERLLGIDYLRRQAQTDGQGVNVVIVDQGLDRNVLGNSYGDGWTVGQTNPGVPRPQPGSVRRPHGMMIAHNILKVAPNVKLFDMPLAPVAKISNISAFLSLADAAFRQMLFDIAIWRQLGKFPGQWILVNPWGIYDRSSEYPRGRYTENPHNLFNLLVALAVLQDIDVVFAAGNCGQFCPDNRCGEKDRGPAHSIWGANSLEPVLTVGAVRADDMWLGYSSQGPGQPRLALGAEKPDLCAASQFVEDDDAFSINSGTSAACGLAGGVVAALRSRWDTGSVPPRRLKQILNQTARRPVGVPWSRSLRERLGHGVLDAKAVFDELASLYP